MKQTIQIIPHQADPVAVEAEKWFLVKFKINLKKRSLVRKGKKFLI